MTLGIAGANGFARYESGVWTTGAIKGVTLALGGSQVVGARRPAIADPSGGSTVDAEARTALGTVLTALRTHGLIAT